MDARAKDVLDFWFGTSDEERAAAPRRWFTKDPAFDAEIRARYLDLFEEAARGELDAWADGPDASAESTLALVVLLDQFSRNLFRDSSRAFDQDRRALAISKKAQASGLARSLSFLERYVLLLPMMHAEDPEVQTRSVEAYARLLAEGEAVSSPVVPMLRNAHDYAQRHEKVVARFGRFPHRNAVLSRTPTPDEYAFLLEPGSSF